MDLGNPVSYEVLAKGAPVYSSDEVQIGKFRLIFMTHPGLQGQRRGGGAQVGA